MELPTDTWMLIMDAPPSMFGQIAPRVNASLAIYPMLGY
jgi:hypothetical protein